MPAGTVADLLRAWGAGEPGALDQLTPAVYGELRKLASAGLSGESGTRPVEPAELAREVCQRLVPPAALEGGGRARFLEFAARLTRRAVVDSARMHGAFQRTRGPAIRVGDSAAPEERGRVVELDAALDKLEQRDPDAARTVELHYFAGLRVAEIASLCRRPERDVARDLAAGRLELARYLRPAR